MSTCSGGCIRPLSASTSSADEVLCAHASLPREVHRRLSGSPPTCVIVVPQTSGRKHSEGSDSEVEEDDASHLTSSPPTPVATASNIDTIQHRPNPPLHGALLAAYEMHQSSATVQFQLPYMTRCLETSTAPTLTDLNNNNNNNNKNNSTAVRRSSSGKCHSRLQSQDEVSTSQTSIDRKSNCSSELGSSHVAPHVSGWRRPTLYRCLDSSQELRMALSFENYRHGNAK